MEFLKNNKRFSFTYGESKAPECAVKTEVNENGNELITAYYFDGGLKFTNVARKIEKFGAYEWVNYLENIADSDTELISELWDCDIALPCEHSYFKAASPWFPDTKHDLFVLNPSVVSSIAS